MISRVELRGRMPGPGSGDLGAERESQGAAASQDAPHCSTSDRGMRRSCMDAQRYDWAVYAQFPIAIPRMPSWWPLNMTWGGLPSAVPPGYIAYFVLPAVIGASLGRWLNAKLQWRVPIALLISGLVVGCLWAFVFNAILGAQLGVFYYGRVIEGLALWPGTKHQYPLYDSLAMGVQMMVFSYILGRTDSQGRTLIEIWADSKSTSRLRSSLLSIAAAIVIGHVVYLSVFAPHLATKLLRLQTVGPTEQLFEGVPNQPL
jgi:hypothetical protein